MVMVKVWLYNIDIRWCTMVYCSIKGLYVLSLTCLRESSCCRCILNFSSWNCVSADFTFSSTWGTTSARAVWRCSHVHRPSWLQLLITCWTEQGRAWEWGQCRQPHSQTLPCSKTKGAWYISSLSPRTKTNPSTDCFQYLEVIYMPGGVLGRD